MKQKFATTKSRPLPKNDTEACGFHQMHQEIKQMMVRVFFYLPKTTSIYSILYSRTAYYLLLLAMLTCVFKNTLCRRKIVEQKLAFQATHFVNRSVLIFIIF